MSQETVLVVDDNRVNRRLAEVLLTKAGYEVRAAADASQAEQLVKEFRPRLILMDLRLPDSGGLELTRRLREDPAAKDALIIAFTADQAEGEEEKAKSAGCDGYIAKPIDARTFMEQIRRYLEPSAAPVSSDPVEVPAEIRREFITEGHESSRAWAEADAASLDLDSLRRAVHHWIGIGGTLGYPEITSRARELEAVLDTSPEQASFVEMRDLFASALAAGFEPCAAVPMQAGIFGFDPQEFARIRSAFEAVNFVAIDLGTLTEGLSLEFFATHDLIVLNACTESGMRAWESAFGREDFQTPVLMIAPLPPVQPYASPADFVFAPWEPEEISFRAQRILSRSAPAEKRRMVLLADDDEMVHALLKAAFDKVNVECRSARDGRAALDAIRDLSPDAAILDIGMPRISGLTVLTEIRKAPETRELPILMLTARKQKSEVSMALGFGANDYVVKPFDPTDVVARLLRLLP
ncbi:MAG TPA: response regulator [Bryobacteraceae bacterium]|nr:response regulator [Bryobacteraceae bacterium]